MTELLTTAQLVALGRSPRDRLVDGLAQGEVAGLGDVVLGLEAGCQSQIDRYEKWTADIEACLVERHGENTRRALVATTRSFVVTYPEIAEVPSSRPASVAARVEQDAAAGDRDAALATFDAMTTRWLRLIDFHRDWISRLLSDVYRIFGADELAEVLRYCGERSVLLGMAGEIERPVVERLFDFVALLHGHFSELAVTEDDEKFTISQDPCGTCSRQVTAGRYAPPVDLAVVTEAHVTTWGRGDTPIYRCHIPIWHIELAQAVIGVPFPVNQCPAGVSDAPCHILLYKDALDERAYGELPLAP